MSTNFCCNDAWLWRLSVPGFRTRDIYALSVGGIIIPNRRKVTEPVHV